ncbi:hypothetical protein [Pseudomonas koreensis]|uniref:hypothetical protein n=1 Tax=Pseudomonas koreensis TaxID=198620 RepID=UPI003F833A8F
MDDDRPATTIPGDIENSCLSAADVQYQAEKERIEFRREGLSLNLAVTPATDKRSTIWGLALSGGGIRSATFCLGVTQAMARAHAPRSRAERASDDDARKFLLPHFDYLSSVSGGGYFGSFFCSLFQGGRLRPYLEKSSIQPGIVERPDAVPSDKAIQEAANNAYKVLRFEPPGRIHTHYRYDEAGGRDVGDGPTAWLRENGRYLTPTGAGDMFYGVALAIRNLLSVHFVIGMPILSLLAFLTLIQMFAYEVVQPYLKEHFAHASLPDLSTSLWWLPLGYLLLFAAPQALGFWLFYSKKNADSDEPQPLNLAMVICVVLACLLLAALIAFRQAPLPHLLLVGFLVFPVLSLAIFWSIWSAYRPGPGQRTIRGFRVQITKSLSSSVITVLALVFLAASLELSQWLYTNLSKISLLPAGVLGAIVWVTRTVTGLMDERSDKQSILKLPLPLLATVLGGVMLCLTVLSWGLLLRWLIACEFYAFQCACWKWMGVFSVLGIALILTAIGGSFFGFLNLSSLQALYSARLTRAYLGASNGYRFKWSEVLKEREEKLSVSDALPGDDLSLEDYYGCQSLAPLHLINVTVNLTVDPTGQLVQRDRKGFPLCIAPSTYRPEMAANGGKAKVVCNYKFILDGIPRIRARKLLAVSEADQALTVGHWIATSGAAFSTGLGRTTSLGTSLVCGLANVRLGTWWPSNFIEEGAPLNQPLKRKDRFLARWLPTPYYLFNELTASFHGHHRDYLYLSDGGHFENTGAYELLRPGRRLDLIVLCDCGADPDYQFEDVANLIRLARLDLKLEIETDKDYLTDRRFSALENIIGCYENFLTKTAKGDDLDASSLVDDQCALLFNVFDRDSEPRQLVCVLLVIKPNMIRRVSEDVRFYSITHPAFPNEPTINQFFNESQFESYRQLGLSIGQLLFGTGRSKNAFGKRGTRESYEGMLWAYLNEKFEKIGKPVHG